MNLTEWSLLIGFIFFHLLGMIIAARLFDFRQWRKFDPNENRGIK